MAESKNIFEEEPDPRIKWALHLLSNDDMETTSILGHYFIPVGSVLSTYTMQMIRKRALRRPSYVGWPVTLGLMTAAWFIGIGTREFLARSKQQEFAILEHYIRLHPDRFIEPETKKYGDKCVLYEWRRLR